MPAKEPWQHLLEDLPQWPAWVRVILVVAASALLAATAAAGYRYVQPILQAARARSQYARTIGTIQHAEVKAETSSGVFGATIRYMPFFKYRYAVMDAQLYGRRYNFDASPFSHEADAQSIVRDHPEGSAVTVYYNPLRPDQAVLEPEISPSGWYRLLWVPLLLALAMLGLWLNVELIALPRALRRFATDELRVPWSIPHWGTMVERGGTVAIRREWATYVSRFLCYYGAAAAACLLIIGASGGAEHVRRETVLWALAIAPAASIALAALPLGSLRSPMRIDLGGRTIRLRDTFVPFDEIAAWSVRVRPRPGRLLGVPPAAALEIILKDGRGIVVRRSQPPPVARKLAIELARLTGTEAIEDEDIR
ncbi:MAG: DUF3592 domain-containing protein [Phycisphaerae bacterium]